MTSGPIPAESARLIDRYAELLREYAAFAYQVRSEGVSDDGDVSQDPRVEALNYQLALLGGELDDAFRAELGVFAPVDQAYEPAAEEADEDDAFDVVDHDVEELELLVYVLKPDGDDALTPWFDAAGHDLVQKM